MVSINNTRVSSYLENNLLILDHIMYNIMYNVIYNIIDIMVQY